MGPVPRRNPGSALTVSPRAGRNTRGRWAEEVAARHLAEHGLVCRDRNFRARHGEIDLVMEDGEVLVFVEVRSRGGSGFMDPAESVDRTKRRKIVRSADTWLRTRKRTPLPACRFDVVAVTGEPEAPEIHWLRGAFDA